MQNTILRAAILLLVLVSAPSRAATNTELKEAVSNIALATFGNQRIRAPKTVAQVYMLRDFEPIWSDSKRGKLLLELQRALSTAEDHGLDASDYHRDALRAGMELGSDTAIELFATDAYLTFAAHLLGGRLNPVSIEPDWTAARRSRDLASYLVEAVRTGTVYQSLEVLAPQQTGYRALVEALASYKAIAGRGGWTAIDTGPALKPGTEGARVEQLRRRLIASGDLEPAEAVASGLFDERLEQAVKVFQRRANLDDDGVVGPRTLAELNRSPADRIATLRANLERWRWLPEDLGDRHIRVNIADFRVEAWQDRQVRRIHDAVVGRTYRKTPVFSAPMTYLVLNPWWEVPSSLARTDKLPQFREDPTVVTRLGYQLVDNNGKSVDSAGINWHAVSGNNFAYRIRQRPGPENALGKVKMMFPNHHNVYLHDTPSRELFERSRRDFSSGCVRVKDPFDLVEWLLRSNGDWPRPRIDEAVEIGRETRVDLRDPVMVHILYLTAVATPDGGVRFVDDIYDRDSRLISVLDAPPPTAR